ncbi:unnamed protein product [Didymodactylos carnosus]|uniref:Glycosyltransferase 61 catalytic domain-containing protein n=1 Tax=Didymodactylos carnosus TaxID=1234261 RepID=A0A814WAP3_9BILA|nr:unnamed protein product [Didymodactylos carnosus]CAF1198803.1 unnamed protein product [Didymodactylos carnosus]CAF3726953.1 unnamed protein product [Didymodactylos carnosus]CAF3963420.1 unnamed protein product [Didymodactylos carnosus]
MNRYWQGQFNVGHLLWEDVANSYLSMVRLDSYSPNAILMNVNKFPPRTNGFERLIKNVSPSFVKDVVQFDDYMKNFSNVNTVCFKTIVAGGSGNFFLTDGETVGKEKMLYDFRSRILIHNGIDLQHPPEKHQILLVNKSHSDWGHQTKHRSRRIIYNLKEVELFLKETYPYVSIVTVEFHKMSFTEQLWIIYNTTILITPCGGVSAMIPFLPKGAHAIIMDYSSTEYFRGWQPNESASMESYSWNYFHHFTKLYYQIRGPEDYVLDMPNTDDVRNYASPIIKMNRLKELVDTAIENSVGLG